MKNFFNLINKNKSFTIRLMRLQAIVVIVIVGSVMLLFFSFWKKYSTRESIVKNQLFVENASSNFQTLVDMTNERTSILQHLYSKPGMNIDLNDWIKNQFLQEEIFKGVHYIPIKNNELQFSEWFSSNHFISNNQKVISPNLLTPSFKDWCYSVVKSSWGKWSEPFFLPFFDMKYGVMYSIPLYNDPEKKNLAGVLSVVIDLELLRLQLENTKAGRKGEIILLSETGRYITHPYNKYYQGRSLRYNFPDPLSAEKLDILVRQIINIKSNYSKEVLEPGSKEHYYFWDEIPITSWKIIYKIPANIVEIGSWTILVRLILAFVIVVSIIIGFFFIIIKHETKPLKQLLQKWDIQNKGEIKNELTLIARELDELTNERDLISSELKKYSMQTESITEELRIARSVQKSILPHGKIIHPSIKMAADLMPAKKIGGDLYDYFMIDANRMCIAIGDVSGHGIGASLYMAIAQTVIHRQTEFGLSSSAEIVERINNELCNEKNYELFLTLFFGILDLDTGWFDYCNSGHNYPYILSPGSSKISRLEETHGIPIGIYPGKKYGSNRVKFDNEDILFAYTDGVVEERNQKKQLFSLERLEQILDRTYNLDPEEIVYEIEDQLSKFRGLSEQDDDITLLAIKFQKKKVEVPVIGIN